MNGIEGVLYLCRCAVNAQAPDRETVAQLDLNQLFRAAERHMLCAMVGMALEAAGIEDPAFKQAVAAAKRKTVILEGEKAAVFRALDAAGIWHMPLKGAVLKDWYPQFGMRESADVDVLFDREKATAVKALLVDMGYEVKSFGHGHHDVYYKKPLTNLQMHVELFGPGYDKAFNDYYENVKDRLLRKSGFEYAFKPEDFYLYHLSHACDHFRKAGIGLRSVLDTYVLLQKFELDMSYIRDESEALGIRTFEERIRALATHVFGGGELTADDREMLRYLAASGSYGTTENAVNNRVAQLGGGRIGKIRYLFHRLFLPMDVIRASYSLFYHHKILLPFLPIYRAVRGLKRHRRRLAAEWKSFFNA